MQISAKTDYALRALCVLAAAPPDSAVKAADIATAQAVPQAFLEGILVDLRRAGLVQSRRGPEGGHRLAKPSYAIVLADVVRAMDGPLALVHGHRPESLTYEPPARHLQNVWVAVRAGLRAVLEGTTLEQVVDGQLPDEVVDRCSSTRSWTSVWPPETG